MKTVYALAAAGLLAFSIPALAQNAGAPGATGTGKGLSGSNTGTSTDSNTVGGASGMSNDGLNEGRAAAPNMTNTPQDPANHDPYSVRGDQNGQGAAKP